VFETKVLAGEFDAFMRGLGIKEDLDPLVDMTFWCAIDPAGPMPVLQVGRHTDVITVCQRGGGSVGRVWKGCSIAEGERTGELEVDATVKPDRCFGNGTAAYHVKGCRPGRPLCRWMRAMTEKYSVCLCHVYPWPHRRGSGLCARPGVR